jgi:hypothetical protein
VVYKDATDILKQRGAACRFLFRGHINLFDYKEGFKAAFVPMHTVRCRAPIDGLASLFVYSSLCFCRWNGLFCVLLLPYIFLVLSAVLLASGLCLDAR